MGVLTVAERLDLLECDRQGGRVRIGRSGQAGFVRQRDPDRGHPVGQDRGDAGVVGGGVAERLDGQGGAQSRSDAPLPVDRAENRVVSRRRRHDGHVDVVLGRRPHQRRPADIDLLDEFVERDARSSGGRGERIEVDDDELERGDRHGQELASVVGHSPIGEDPGVDPRVERLHPPIEHLREAGHVRHLGHRQTGFAKDPCRATGGDELETRPHQPGRECCETRLVRDGQERPSWRREQRIRGLEIHDDATPIRGDRQRAREEEGHGARQQPVLDGTDPCMEGGVVVAWQDRDGLLRDDRTAIERLVHEMDRAAGHRDPVSERVGDGVGAREHRQQRRMRVEDPATEGRQHGRADDPHVSSQDDGVGAGGLQRLGDRRIIPTRDEGRLDPLLCGPIQGGAATVGEDQYDPAAKLASPGRSGERPKVRAGSRYTDRDPTGRPGAIRPGATAHASRSRGPST